MSWLLAALFTAIKITTFRPKTLFFSKQNLKTTKLQTHELFHVYFPFLETTNTNRPVIAGVTLVWDEDLLAPHINTAIKCPLLPERLSVFTTIWKYQYLLGIGHKMPEMKSHCENDTRNVCITNFRPWIPSRPKSSGQELCACSCVCVCVCLCGRKHFN